jgi:hypothetical protein
MLRGAFIRVAAFSLVLYGLLGVVIGLAMAYAGHATLSEVERLRSSLERERGSLAETLRTVSRTVSDTVSATSSTERSLVEAHASADAAARLAQDGAANFRMLAYSVQFQILGVQPLVGLAPGFEQTAASMDQLAGTLGATGEALQQNAASVTTVSRDLDRLRQQVAQLASTVERATVVMPREQMLALQVAYYGMCLLFVMQSLFSLIAGVALYRQQELLALLAALVATQRAAPAAERAPTGRP